MDNSPDGVNPSEFPPLSYDETIPYEEQIPPTDPSDESEGASASLLNRIGTTKVYVLPDNAQARVAKRRRTSENDDDIEMDEDELLRANALLLSGSPISRLPTARIFAYATHFDAHPLALEWLNDTSCILVFESKTTARTAYRYLQKSPVEDADEVGFITAKSIPIALWPPEDRINKSLGKGEGLKGVIRMRWAKNDDVKRKGAKKESEFYKKYGDTAGKDVGGEGPQKRRRKEEESLQKSQLDDDLDAFVSDENPLSPPSKMRSDYLDSTGKTLLERTSVTRENNPELRDRVTASLPRRGRRHQLADNFGDGKWDHRDERRSRNDSGTRRKPRPRATQQDLDDELDAFLNEKD
ncbi:hypothetical protein BJ138DRAFT_1140221 [Hygrophoropsis aurantiaca]|uniref:Uncharacterized protein n=1 Tax=Hygrophoropsis aurantiaca TaxID=72124 RepID=A0ACB8ASV6_9AGAM|nr:hypothetical protein BJ138DRAFT_1140221 [Hygrophoropsis aurantiaca]